MYAYAYRGSGNDRGYMKLNSSGTVQWVKSFNGFGSNSGGVGSDDAGNLWIFDGTDKLLMFDSNGNPIRSIQLTTTGAFGFTSRITINEGYLTMVTRGRTLGLQTSSYREETLGIIRAEISGINNGSFTHTNSDGSTLTVTVSTPSTGSVTNHSSPSITNSSQVSIINYAGNTATRLNNGSLTNFTNSSPPYGKTLTV